MNGAIQFRSVDTGTEECLDAIDLVSWVGTTNGPFYLSGQVGY